MASILMALLTSTLVALPAAGLPDAGGRGGLVPGRRAAPLAPEQVRRTLAHRLSRDELADLLIPFEADDAIRRLATEVTAGAHGDHQKLRALRHYFGQQGFLERYDRDGTLTARQVMASGRGNCLSYANLFVAMARSVGLKAHYLDASAQVDAFGKSGSVLVQWGHVLVGVQIGPEWIAVDFDGRAGRPHRYRVISDLEAIADFYNNLGSELAWTRRGEGGFASEGSLHAFSVATRVSPGFARAWNNLGVALARAGRPREAVRAYRRAVRLQPGFAAPYANLGQLHLRSGEQAAAARAWRRAVHLAPTNAHYRYHLGKLLAADGHPDEAAEQLRAGADLDPDLFLIHLELARLYAAAGDREHAQAAARRVLELVPGQRDARLMLGGQRVDAP